MSNDKVKRPCSSHKEWDKMTQEEKIETLFTWANYMTEWAEKMLSWTKKVKNVMFFLNGSAKGLQDATKHFASKEGNGGPPPPKPPRDPGC